MFGEDHPEVAENLNGYVIFYLFYSFVIYGIYLFRLAQVYKNQFKYAQAEEYYLKVCQRIKPYLVSYFSI